MSPWKNRIVLLTMTLLSVSFPIFLVTGYAALYWAGWRRVKLCDIVSDPDESQSCALRQPAGRR